MCAPYSLEEVYRRFRGACRLHHQGDESRRNNPVDSCLHTCRRENLKFHYPELDFSCFLQFFHTCCTGISVRCLPPPPPPPSVPSHHTPHLTSRHTVGTININQLHVEFIISQLVKKFPVLETDGYSPTMYTELPFRFRQINTRFKHKL
jgi:hypothetical protein